VLSEGFDLDSVDIRVTGPLPHRTIFYTSSGLEEGSFSLEAADTVFIHIYIYIHICVDVYTLSYVHMSVFHICISVCISVCVCVFFFI
jgi:hypothetical protein